MSAVIRSPYMTHVGVARDQPVPFSHKHHVEGLGIDCRYCHTSVENSSFAGLPPAKTCMNCHSIMWNQAPILEPIRESFRTGKPVAWTRVHDLPDFVYFDHSIHVAKGVACVVCHGQVNEMPLMSRANTLHMEWCLQCHRAPENFIRPKEKVFDMHWKPENQKQMGQQLVAEYQIHKNQLTNCSVCHR
ncbi:MAG TPA: cytochrome c3 family protein [Verrucomicrobiae bacterium]|nr:cytochrome c3 family protein [Verrucomicrobiae bacterium]